MSNEPVVSMRELEMESAELLPSRETLCACKGSGHSSSFSYTSQSYNGDGSFLPILNGANVLDGNNVNILGVAWQSQ
jgi:hypothetical protein